MQVIFWIDDFWFHEFIQLQTKKAYKRENKYYK